VFYLSRASGGSYPNKKLTRSWEVSFPPPTKIVSFLFAANFSFLVVRSQGR